MERQQKILKILLSTLSDKVISVENVIKYIDFCLSHDKGEKIKNTTNHHHIIPKCNKQPTFQAYASLKRCPWNGVHLTFYDHYYAHFLLIQAIDYNPFLYSFTSMHYKNKIKTKILPNEINLISEKDFNDLMVKRNIAISVDKTSVVEHKGEIMTKARRSALSRVLSDEQKEQMRQRMQGSNNIVYREGVVEKIRTKKKNTFVDGVPMDTIGARRSAKTMKTPYINDNNEITTIYKESGKKISESLRTLIIDETGMLVTKAEIRGRLRSERHRRMSEKYIVKNVFDPSVYMILTIKDIRDISPALDTKTIDNYLGKSRYGQTIFIKTQRPHLIGLYVEGPAEVLQ